MAYRPGFADFSSQPNVSPDLLRQFAASPYAGQFGIDPAQTGGILSGQQGVVNGPLSGNRDWRAQLGQFLDPQVAMPIAAQLMGGANLQDSLAGGFAAAGQAIPDMRKRAAVNAWLRSRSTGEPLSAEAQQMIAADPVLAQKLAEHDLGVGAGDGSGDFGLQPLFGERNGEAVILQPRRSGGVSEAKLPSGVTLRKKPIEVNTGTEIILMDPITHEVISRTPIDVAAAASQKTQGEAQGAAAVNLPVVEDAARRLTDTLDEALAKPEEISRVTGPAQSWLPNISGRAHAGQAILNQIQGQTFLQAYQQLKGGGAITDVEGAKATTALNKLSETGVNDEQYVKYLQEFKVEVQKLVDLARRKAAAGVPAGAPAVPAAAPAGAPAAGAADPFGIR